MEAWTQIPLDELSKIILDKGPANFDPGFYPGVVVAWFGVATILYLVYLCGKMLGFNKAFGGGE